MRTVSAVAAPSATDPLAPMTIERRELGPRDVSVEIKYCGICHSDIHTARGEWQGTEFPIVPGHEITGTVEEVGPAVSGFSVGDRVGVGVMVGSCGSCARCLAGEQQYCLEGTVFTYGSIDRDGRVTQGGYSTHIVVPEEFVLRIPQGLDLAEAAPLLCAGITTYSPLRHWGAGPGTRVAVVGLGGLGHVGVKIGHALGAEVTVLSHSGHKRRDGLRMGAEHYEDTSDPETFERLAGSFDLMVNTVSAHLDIDSYLSLLAVDGTMVNVGLPGEPLSVDVFRLTTMRRSIAGSSIGGVLETQEMLQLCAERGLGADIEMVAADQVNEAYERVLASDVRYRFVIDMSTLA